MRGTPKQSAVSFDQLESSKENIQPLLRSAGKRMHSLARNLRQTPKALTQKQERERKQWENAIKHDKSNDPLPIWLKYIKWTKLNFTCPTNQKAQLLPLIERCTRKFKDDPRYINNKKYIKLWLEYSHLSRDSIEIFNFMHSNKIGHKLALFWRGWAIVAEQNENYDLVNRIFNQAKQVQAQPIQDINKSYDAFLARMRKKIQNQDFNDMNDINDSQNYMQSKRSTLGQLSDKATSHRNNSTKSRGFGREIMDKPKQDNQAFGIYCDNGMDENIPPQGDGRYLPLNNDIKLPPINKGWRELGTDYNRKKENDGIATQWNQQGFGSQV